MAHKLTDITTSFHSFAKEQVLTDTQLNEFLDYFDEQDRLNRICLSGVGIACGFELSVKSNQFTAKKIASTSIVISQGAGVTTDGDLIHLVEKIQEKDRPDRDVLTKSIEYTHYREYEGDKVDYHPHFNAEDSNSKFKKIPLIEIVSKAEALKTDTSLNNLDLSDKIALFYLEAYPLEPDNCVTINCDNQGIEQVNRLRVLLVDIEHVGRITKPDALFNSYTKFESYLSSIPVRIPRVILNKSNTLKIERLAQQYQKDPLILESRSNLKSGIGLILKSLGMERELTDFISDFDSIFPENEATKLISFQYKYDLLKDLADSYNELKGLFLESYESCCPDITAFPKHLLLGRVIPKNQSLTTAKIKDEREWRHKFHKSPILLDSKDGNGHFESVLRRILTLVSQANLSTLETFRNELITITPSNVRVPLGKRAVPFYYDLSQELIENWDYDKRKFGQYKSTLGYRLAENNPSNPTISDPLRYSLDPYNFYRIEGHQGYLFRDVFEQLTELKEAYSLPFDIKVLGIGVEDFDDVLEEQYKCDFKDLAVLLSAWTSEQVCIAKTVTDVLSNFSTSKPGSNLAEVRFYETRHDLQAVYTGIKGANKESLYSSIGDEFTTQAESYQKFAATTNSSSEEAVKEENSVLSYISQEDDTIGVVLDQSIKNAGGNYSNAIVYAMNALQQYTSGLDELVAQGTVFLPAEISLILTNLIGLIPSSITTLTNSTLVDYGIQLNLLCSKSKKLQSAYGEGKLTAEVSAETRSMVSISINQLSSICCSAKKLQALLEEVERRKAEIIKRLDFSNFVDNNPGLEHKAGVGPGQTFVLVYLNRSIRKELPTNAFSNANLTAANPSSKNEAEAARYYQVKSRILIEKGTVIADFMLPYLCCSDCAPINFVLPDVPVSLSISSDGYCLDEENLELDLTVSPDDGIVTVVDSVPGVNIENRKLSIDRSIFPTELLGTALQFKVDDKMTDAELIVSKTPTIDFTFPNPETERIVNFTVTGDDFPGLIYAWDFGNGETSEEREPTHDFTEPASSSTPERTDYDVTLTVTSVGGICPAVIGHSISFDTVDVEVTLPQTVFCAGDPTEHFFLFKPSNIGGITVSGEGVDEGAGFFSSELLTPDTYTLDVSNGDTIEVIVVEKPTIEIAEIQETENGFSTSVTLPEGVPESTITWTFTDPVGSAAPVVLHESVSGTTNIDIDFSNFSNENWTEVKITMTVDVAPCGTVEDFVVFSRTVKFELPQYTFCQDDEGEYSFKFTPNQPMIVTGVGIDSPTSNVFKPFGLEIKSHKLIAENQEEIVVTIVDPSVGTLDAAVLDEANNMVELRFTPNGGGANLQEIKWSIGKSVIGDLGDLTNPTGESYFVSLEEWGFQPGETLLYQATLTTEFCGDKIVSGSFAIPGEKPSCSDSMVADLQNIYANKPSREELQLYIQEYFIVDQITAFYDLIEDMYTGTGPSDVLNGSFNDQVVVDIRRLINTLEAKMGTAGENVDLLNLLFGLYRMALKVYAQVFRCQKVSFTNFKEGIHLNSVLANHFDNTSPNSIISRGFVIFDSGNTTMIRAILKDQNKSNQPWKTISFVISATMSQA